MLIKPIITEKSLSEANKKGYTFRVEKSATKKEIKKVVEKLFDVKVLAVRTIILPGKSYRSGKKWIIRDRSDWKKAIVTIQPDKQIDLFEAAVGEK